MNNCQISSVDPKNSIICNCISFICFDILCWYDNEMTFEEVLRNQLFRGVVVFSSSVDFYLIRTHIYQSDWEIECIIIICLLRKQEIMGTPMEIHLGYKSFRNSVKYYHCSNNNSIKLISISRFQNGILESFFHSFFRCSCLCLRCLGQ